MLEFASTNSAGGFGIALDDVSVVPDLGVEPVVPGFTFGVPSAGGNDGEPLELAQGASDDDHDPGHPDGWRNGRGRERDKRHPGRVRGDRDHGRRRHGILDRHGRGLGERGTRAATS